MNRRSFFHGKGENCRENLNKNNVHTRENIVTQNIAFLVSSLTFKKILSTLHNIGHIVEKEKSMCVESSLCRYEVGSRRHEEKYQRVILARTWTGLIKGGMFSFIL